MTYRLMAQDGGEESQALSSGEIFSARWQTIFISPRLFLLPQSLTKQRLRRRNVSYVDESLRSDSTDVELEKLDGRPFAAMQCESVICCAISLSTYTLSASLQ